MRGGRSPAALPLHHIFRQGGRLVLVETQAELGAAPEHVFCIPCPFPVHEIDQLGGVKIGAEAFAEAQALFGNKGVMDLTGLVGYYTFVNYTLKTFDVQRTPGSRLLLPLP